jgi:hypothetical protein
MGVHGSISLDLDLVVVVVLMEVFFQLPLSKSTDAHVL